MSESSTIPPTPPSVGLHPELAAAAASVAEVTEHLRALTDSMTDTQFNWHPKAGEWSVAEVLDHLTTLHNLMLPRFEQGMARAREQGWQPNPHQLPKPGPLGKLFIWANQPHAWTKIKTPAPYTPPLDRPRAVVLSEFFATQAALLACIRATGDVDTGRVRVVSPVSDLLVLNLYTWLLALAAHLHLHTAQIEGIVAVVGYLVGGA